MNPDECKHADTMYAGPEFCGTEGCYGASVHYCRDCRHMVITCACGCANDVRPLTNADLMQHFGVKANG